MFMVWNAAGLLHLFWYNHYIKEVGYLSYYRTTIDEKSSVISIVDYISKRVGNQYNRVEDLENILNIFIDNLFIQYKRELRKNIQSQVLDEIQEKEKWKRNCQQ